MLTRQRDRMLIKLTGWSRIGFLNEVFPDAKFIHIVRDGRAVASSYLHINEWQWRGWYGPASWRYGPLSPEDQAAWEASGRSFIALAGIQWRMHTRAIESARARIDPARFLEVRYEDSASRSDRRHAGGSRSSPSSSGPRPSSVTCGPPGSRT